MPLSPLDAKRFLLSYNEELATTPMPFYGINITDVSEDNFVAFQEAARQFGEPGCPIPECLGCTPYHYSMRNYGNGRLRILGIWYYKNPFDVEAYNALTIDNPDYVSSLLSMFDLVENYQWFTTCEVDQSAA